MEPMRAMVAYLMMVLMTGSAGGNLPAAPAPAAPTASVVIETDQLAPGIHRMLWRGMKGNDVKLMQLRMIELGYLTGKADGDFGGQTEQALKRFQFYHSLIEDGMAGADTLRVMFSTSAVVAPPEVEPTLPPPPPTLPPVSAPPTAEPSLPPAPPTFAPATLAPATQVPATQIPATPAPATQVPATLAPATLVPATPLPETPAPPTLAPEVPTEAPTEIPTETPIEVPTETPTATPEMTTPSPVPPTMAPGSPLIPVVPRPEILVVMDGVVLPVVAVQDAQGQHWLLPYLTLGDILGYTATVLEESGSFTFQLERLNPETGESLEEIGLSFSVGEDGQPTVAMLLKNDNVSLLDADIQLILDENTLYVPIEFVQRVLGYAAVVDGAGIHLAPMETPAP